jgi:hypothetical protein
MPGAPVREIAAVGAADDISAESAAIGLSARWPGFETIELYEGERVVAVLTNPHLGFAREPLEILRDAA